MTDEALAELLTLTRTVDERGTITYRDSAGRVHRTHGPAVIHADGTQIWFRDGLLHRSDGPAVVRISGECYWWLDGGHCHPPVVGTK